MILDKLTPKKEDIKGLANGAKDTLTKNAKSYLDLKNGPLKESFELAKTAAIAKLIAETKDLGNKILDIEINDNNISSFNLYDELLFNDVTFIETPVLLQMYDVIRYANTLLEIEDKEQRMNSMERPKISLQPGSSTLKAAMGMEFVVASKVAL